MPPVAGQGALLYPCKSMYFLLVESIQNHYPRSFPHYHIEENRERIEKFVNPYQPLYFSLWDKNKNDIIFKIGNTSMLPAKVKKIEIIDNNNQLSLIDLTKEKSLLNTIYFDPRFFKKPIEYK